MAGDEDGEGSDHADDGDGDVVERVGEGAGVADAVDERRAGEAERDGFRAWTAESRRTARRRRDDAELPQPPPVEMGVRKLVTRSGVAAAVVGLAVFVWAARFSTSGRLKPRSPGPSDGEARSTSELVGVAEDIGR